MAQVCPSPIPYNPSPSPILSLTRIPAGTGASVARKFASLYPVVLLARKPENYTPIVDEINKSGGKALGISTDVTDAKSVSVAFEKIKAELPGLGLAAAVYNVGGQFVRTPFLELSEVDFLAGYETNGYDKAFLTYGFLSNSLRCLA